MIRALLVLHRLLLNPLVLNTIYTASHSWHSTFTTPQNHFYPKRRLCTLIASFFTSLTHQVSINPRIPVLSLVCASAFKDVSAHIEVEADGKILKIQSHTTTRFPGRDPNYYLQLRPPHRNRIPYPSLKKNVPTSVSLVSTIKSIRKLPRSSTPKLISPSTLQPTTHGLCQNLQHLVEAESKGLYPSRCLIERMYTDFMPK
ncbi:hypothetical protein ABVK25_011508 [Lepraria finkii]|uniref:Uncharacterized protein n=1 Tax=Lepraria finkii TaxID=1340010 RepID=A0ABR4ARG1_9LECA